VAGDWGDNFGHHVVGVWQPDRRELRLSHDNESGPTYRPEDYSKEGPGLLPFSGRWWANWTSVGFYDPGEDGRAQFVLYPCDFGPPCYPVLGGRRPILLPPPEDPVGSSCVGAQ
jgi:hypothetical protein